MTDLEKKVDPDLAQMARDWQNKDRKRREKEGFRRERAIAALKAEGVKEPREHQIRARIFLIKEEAKKKYLLKNCRVTIGEVVAAAAKKEAKK